MTEQTEHTFVVLAYKESPYIEECIQSLQKQTVRSRILLSTSTPSQFLDRVAEKHRIELARNKSGGGIGADWTFAYECANSQFVTLAHQDDIYYPDYTESCLAAILGAPEFLVAFTDYDELVGKLLRKQTPNMVLKRVMLSVFFTLSRSLDTRFLKRAMLSLGSPIACPSVMFNKKTIGHFTFAPDLSVSLDWEAWLRLSRQRGAFVYVRKLLMTHRIHPESQTTACIHNDQRKKEDRMIFEQIWPMPIAHVLASLYAWSYRSNE
jgi:glycosyltransferase involved in cell wall biosynthesis